MQLKTYIFSFCFLIISIFSYSQSTKSESINCFSSSSDISLSQPTEVKNLLESYVSLNKKRKGQVGYRVKIYAQNHHNARSQANAIRLNFNVDGNKAYVIYNEPNFEVHVGDFTQRFDAIYLLNKIQVTYPEAYIIKTIISCSQ